MVGAGLGGWEEAGQIPSIEPTCSRAAVEPSSAGSPAAEAMDSARLRVVFG